MTPETVEPPDRSASEHEAPGFTDTRATAETRLTAGRRRRRDSIRFRLASLVLACVLPVWIVAGFLVYRNYQSRRANTEQHMLDTARALTMVVDRELSNMKASLSVIATSPSLVSGDLRAFDRQVKVILEDYPGADIVLSDANGQLLVHTLFPFGAPLPRRNATAAVQQVYATGKPTITNVFRGAATGRFMISVDVPVFRDGRVIYDLAMTVPLDRFAAILSRQNIPQGWLGRIFDNNQVEVARTVLAERYIGRHALPVMSQQIKDNAEGKVEAINFEGVRSFNSFSRSATSGWTVAIGVPKAIMMAETWRWLWWMIAGTALLSLTGIALALPIGRSVERIEKRSRRLSAIVECSDDAIIGCRSNGMIESWNAGAERLFGYCAPEIVGRHISILVPDDQLEDFPERLQRVCDGAVVEQDGTTRKHKDGSPIPVALKISPTFDRLGTIVGASAIVRDISERRRAEAALEEREQHLRTILQTMQEAFYLVDTQGRLLDVNDAYCLMSGYTREELLRMQVQDLECAESAQEVAAHTRQIMCQGRDRFETRHRRKDGQVIDVESSVTFQGISGGRFVCFLRDITERKRAEEQRERLEQQLRQAQKMEAIGRLAGGVAHDFNNILMIIQSYTEMLQDCLADDNPLRRNTQEVLKASSRAASLTRQMLAFSRKQILSPVALDLTAVIYETAKMLKRLIGEDIDFQVRSAESLWTVKADSDQMVQVLMNLCVNARDAMPQGGTLTVATGNVTMEEGSLGRQEYVPLGDYVWLSVTDTGIGISKETQGRIFDPFFTTKEVGKGTGLGLATVYGIVKQSGGYVWVESELGHGACFTIYLPRVKQAITPEMPAHAEAQPRGTETILVAEDEQALREAICDYLRSLGYTVLATGSGKEALSVASHHDEHIDLLITDVVMPGMSGRELSQMLGSLRPDLKRIFMSGYSDDAVLRHGIHVMGAAFLQKPFSLGTLARKVRDTLGRTETVQ